MRKFVMAYCIHSQSAHYMGHKLKHIEADTPEEAEQLGHAWLAGLLGKGDWEYVIMENPSSYRIYNTKTLKRA